MRFAQVYGSKFLAVGKTYFSATITTVMPDGREFLKNFSTSDFHYKRKWGFTTEYSRLIDVEVKTKIEYQNQIS